MRPSALLFASLLALAGCADTSLEDSPTEALPSFRGDLEVVDDAGAVPAFAALRDTLRAVVARRDTAALLALVAPEARLSFGDDPPGPSGFRAIWFGGDAPEPIWDALPRILDGGCVEEDGAVVIPAVAALWPHDLDPFAHVAVQGEDVLAFDAPGGTAVATVHRVALATAGPAADGWQPVVLPDGQEAVVSQDHVLSPVGYRATFWDDGDGWRLRAFLAGD